MMMVELATLQAVSYIMGSLGVFIAAVYYVFNMRSTLQARQEANRTQQQQLATRQAQMFMEIYKQASTKEFNEAIMRIFRSQWSSYAEYQVLYQDKEFRDASNLTQMYFEGLGVLVKEGLLDIRWVALLMCGMTRHYVEKHLGMLEEGRKAVGHPRWFSEAEYLYGELMRYLGEHPELQTRIERPIF